MTDNLTPKAAKKVRWTSLEISLITIVSLLFIALVALTVLFSAGTRHSARCRCSPLLTAAPVAASRLLENMDPTVDPCENFYQYACGGWLKRNIIPETSARHSTFDILRDELEVVLKGVLEGPAGGGSDALTKARTLFKSCTDESNVESRGGRPLLGMLGDILEWPVATDSWDDSYGETSANWTLESAIARLNEKYRMQVLINFFVGTDDRDSNAYIIHVGVPRVRLHQPLSAAPRPSTKQFLNRFPTQMFAFAALPRPARRLSAPCHNTPVDTLAKGLSAEPLDVDVSGNVCVRQEFNWTQFTNYILNTVNITVSDDEDVIVYAPNYLSRLSLVLANYTARDIQNYIAWRFVMNLVGGLSKAYRDTRKVFRKALYGTTSEEALWRQCANYVNNNMENAVGRLYVEEAFNGESKHMVRRAVSECVVPSLCVCMFVAKRRREDLLQPLLLYLSHHIIRSLWEQIPLHLSLLFQLNYSAEEYFENILKNLEFIQKKRLKKLRAKVNKEEWITGAAIVNAFYSSSRNQIVFPAGILQPPFFGKGQAMSLNYGGIGMVIGHEITHGFDDNGRNFDKDGDLKDWWTPGSSRRFQELAKCMVQQYGNFSWDLANGQNLSGNNTLGENIADNGGIRQSYQAYLNYMNKHGPEKPLPGIDLNHKQLFFLNFAQVWCGTHRPEHAVNSIKTDAHSPGKFRVLGSLQNFPEFARVFKCQRTSFMVPEKTCHVW
uniref:Neprilysin n=1 Tax=Scleropages formosus TaxID=113540 RepID=A0A8C9WAF4_SCLFO